MNTLNTTKANGLNQEEAREILKPFLKDIYASVADGWSAWVRLAEVAPELRLPLKSRSRASFVFDHIVDSAKKRFQNKKGVICTEKKGLFRLIFSNGIVIRFKKFDKYGRTSSIPTKQSQLFRLQYSLDLDEVSLNLIGGYRLDEFNKDIRDILITCPAGKSNQWYLEIPPVEIPNIQTITHTGEAKPRVRAKTSAQTQRKAN